MTAAAPGGGDSESESESESEPPVTTSYANAGGTGNRPTFFDITAWDLEITGPRANLFNGVTSGDFTTYFSGSSVAGKAIDVRFADAVPRVIDAWRFRKSEAGFGTATFKMQGWNGSTWTDLSSDFALSGEGLTSIEVEFANTTAYLGYRMLGVSGNTSSGPWFDELEFRIS